jgi:hypothetical protein
MLIDFIKYFFLNLFRWDVSHDGHLDQNELAHLISAMVKILSFIFSLIIITSLISMMLIK